eukprot:CAMPEP_0116037712 /NCGR_PEP_ID=MMETSP0321-20121206/22239_1 /TAXON_ID=163516 /ORGANISM="Leptocylindrus danicus var. danicus, Strain B650" /LENGTH=474 /DNA_ID=CAMNT_0003516013 /DNA_START=59 /DNA_END=1484 /DNA_ORIENTATION=+
MSRTTSTSVCATADHADNDPAVVTDSSSSSKRLVLPHLEKSISVLYHDSSIIVINKPSKLRSVPGHANNAAPIVASSSTTDVSIEQEEKEEQNTIGIIGSEQQRDPSVWQDTKQVSGPPPMTDEKKRCYHETWAYALQKAAALDDYSDDEPRSISVGGLLKGLASLPNSSAVPRKRRTFIRYCVRTHSRLIDFPRSSSSAADENTAATRLAQTKEERIANKAEERALVEKLAEKAFTVVHDCQIPMLNLPEPTKDEESALGQLRLLGFEPSREIPIKVVHRLDMETSGIMVFARTDNAASKLCAAWRERDIVHKQYVALVKRWPPFHEDGLSEGTIDYALAPSEERLKWEVREDGKSSETRWKIMNVKEESSKNMESSASTSVSPVLLSLVPVTGRTHQLRIHCATVGSGIIGDSLYGDNPVDWTEDIHDEKSILKLHASYLSIPHPVQMKNFRFSAMRLGFDFFIDPNVILNL